jgi:hypothetical protein
MGRSGLENDVLSLDVTKLAQALPERLKEGRAAAGESENTYPWDFSGLLRFGRHMDASQRCNDHKK